MTMLDLGRMELARTTAPSLLTKVQLRALRARSLARWLKMSLMALCLTAIWQERALAPSVLDRMQICLFYTHPSPRDRTRSRMPSSA